MAICDICKQPTKQYVWHNVPIGGTSFDTVCDSCAVHAAKTFLEENSPEYSREAASHYADYKEAVALIESIKVEDGK